MEGRGCSCVDGSTASAVHGEVAVSCECVVV